MELLSRACRREPIAIEGAPSSMSLTGISGSEIFIVDDDEAVCDALAMTFAVEGYQVTTFRDGTSFIATARTRTPACVLLDVHMPVKSGLDILKELDGGNYPAPILIMSGSGDIPTAVEAINDGAHDFLEKRQGTAAIVARVRQAIGGWQPRRQQDSNGGGATLSESFAGCDRLTPREYDVLSEVVAGATSHEAAKALGISRRTVEIHRLHITKKLGARNTMDLVRMVLSTPRTAKRPRDRDGSATPSTNDL
jgi:two-component system response regulator FixJ